ncbi:MAG: NAD(P)H-dependent oxidoreductase [Verrucomicrobia bacterium]|nr:NAD(P)H-dependent oxidoreductase [Verrucomicrobiota bacterium]
MGKVLHIIATPRGKASRTLQVSASFLTAFKERHPDWRIDSLDLYKEQLPPLSVKRVDGKYMLLEGKELFGEAKESWEEVISHIERFLAASHSIKTIFSGNSTIPMWERKITQMGRNSVSASFQRGSSAGFPMAGR